MTTVESLPLPWRPFFTELRAVVMANERSRITASFGTPRAAMAWMRTTVRYRYDRGLPVADIDAVVQRGWGACAEAAALVVAVARRRRETAFYCLEEVDDEPSYAHVVACVNGEVYDVFAERSFAVRRYALTVEA